jgi:hypothetical protein
MMLEVETLVFVLQVVLHIEFGVFLQRLAPMEVASFLTPIDGNLRNSRPVDNPNKKNERTVIHSHHLWQKASIAIVIPKAGLLRRWEIIRI